MRKWKSSKLSVGQRVIISPNLLTTGKSSNLIRSEYEGETEYGLIIHLYFRQGLMSHDSAPSYRMFVSWADLYCGDVKLKDSDGNNIRAEVVVNE